MTVNTCVGLSAKLTLILTVLKILSSTAFSGSIFFIRPVCYVLQYGVFDNVSVNNNKILCWVIFSFWLDSNWAFACSKRESIY